MRNINFANLETAIWVARLGSYTAAAERLHTTQPAISARMRELENSLGIKLFTRVGRGIELTLEGRNFLGKAEPLLRELDELASTLTTDGRTTGTVRIGLGNISMSWFPCLIHELQGNMPGLTYDVEIDLAGKLLDKLEARKLDLALVAGPVDAGKFRSASLGFDRMLWLTSKEYYACARQPNLRAFLKNAPLWCVHKESFYWTDAMRIIVEQGADPGRFNAITNMAAARELILGHAGVGLVSQTLVRHDLDDGRLITVPGCPQPDWVELSIAVLPENAGKRPITDIMRLATQMSTLYRNPESSADKKGNDADEKTAPGLLVDDGHRASPTG